MKAYFGKKGLIEIQERYQAMKEKLLASDRADISFQRKVLLCFCDPALGVIQDFLKKRLVSTYTNRTLLYLIRLATLLSLDREKEFREDNEPLLNDSDEYLLLSYGNNRSNKEEKRKEELRQKFSAKCREDLRFASAPSPDSEEDLSVPFLLNVPYDELTRSFLGYLFEDQALYLKDHLGNGKISELEEKYELTYFNDSSRMLFQVLEQAGGNALSPLKISESGFALSMKNNNRSMENVLKRVLLKVRKVRPDSELERILLQLKSLEASRVDDLTLGIRGRKFLYLEEKLLLLFRLFSARKEVRALLSGNSPDFVSLSYQDAVELLSEAYSLSDGTKENLSKIFLFAEPNLVNLSSDKEAFYLCEEALDSVEKRILEDGAFTLKEILPLKIELESAEEVLAQRQTVLLSERRKRK